LKKTLIHHETVCGSARSIPDIVFHPINKAHFFRTHGIRKEKVVFFKMLVLVIPLVILAPFEAYAGTATQTDWFLHS
jgi:hypothetical protein